MNTYTNHRLTDAQCKVLASFIAEESSNGKVRHKHGIASAVLKRKGLVERFEHRGEPGPCCTITDAGRKALEQARGEGW